MDALLAGLSHIWRTGGAGHTIAHGVASGLSHAYRGAASVLCGSEQQPGRLQQWAFFIMSPDGRHCQQLHGAPKDVALARMPSSSVLQCSMETFMPGAPDALMDEQQWSFSKGVRAAEWIMEVAPKYFAAVPVATYYLEEALGVGSHEFEAQSAGAVHLCMWRRDVIAAVQAQLGLRDAAAVPCKVWRRLGRAGLSPVPGANLTGSLVGFDVAGLLVCWECGSMSGELNQCSRCGIACYCSKECQRANYSSGHRRWCKGLAGKLAQEQVSACPSAAYKSCCEDRSAAVLRKPQAVALCNVVSMQVPMQLARAMAGVRTGQGGAAASPSTRNFSVEVPEQLMRELAELSMGQGGAAASPSKHT